MLPETVTHAPQSIADHTPAACATCHAPLHGRFCSECGEKRLNRHDYALKHFLEHTVDILTHFDLRVLRDLWWQVRRPGWLAAEWMQGRRVRHAPPVQLFLITNLLFYLLAGLTNFSPFQTRLPYHFTASYGAFAQDLVQHRLAERGIAMADYATRFDASVHVYSKSLVFLFIPMLALPLWLLLWRQRRYFIEWLVLSTYLFGGVLLVFGSGALLSLLVKVLPATQVFFNDDSLIGPVMFVLTGIYMALFVRGAFSNQKRWVSGLKGFLLVVAFLLALFLPYRFLLFLITYWSA